jgi:hypothetical protein
MIGLAAACILGAIGLMLTKGVIKVRQAVQRTDII